MGGLRFEGGVEGVDGGSVRPEVVDGMGEDRAADEAFGGG